MYSGIGHYTKIHIHVIQTTQLVVIPKGTITVTVIVIYYNNTNNNNSNNNSKVYY